MMKKLVVGLVLLFPLFCFAQNNTQKVSAYFNSIQSQPGMLQLFLLQMPKGGELHYHIDGAPYPENLIYDVQGSSFCLNPETFGVSLQTNCPAQYNMNNIAQNPLVYDAIIDNWSLNQDLPTMQAVNNHFFHSFINTAPILAQFPGKIVAEEMQRAALQHENYLEIIFIPNVPENMALGSKITYSSDFPKMESELQALGVQKVVDQMKATTTYTQESAQQALKCGTPQAMEGCQVKVRYMYAALRIMSRTQIFEQIMAGFMLVQQDQNVVGVNFVMPENDYTSIHDYNFHMQMFAYFHKKYPNVKMSLHAGELSLQTTAPEYMREHIDQAVNVAGASRIGHGVDIMSETNAIALLHEMAAKHILVEQCLTSNERVLGVKGKWHSLPVYLHYGVPVSLCTDDEGILRTNITQEYVKAVTRYKLSYMQIKDIARNAIAYSFLPGDNLWKNLNTYKPVDACKNDVLGSATPSTSCAAFLKQSEKAQMQWQLEAQFKTFEATIVKEMKA